MEEEALLSSLSDDESTRSSDVIDDSTPPSPSYLVQVAQQ